jgi:hypothetical protein
MKISDQDYKFSCSNKNVKAKAESKRPVLANDPCGPNLIEPKQFEWLPNTPNPSITFALAIN